MSQRWYTIKEAAERLAVSHDTVSRLVERGELPAIRVSRRIVRIPVPAFEVFVTGRKPTVHQVVRRRVADGVQIGAGERSTELERA